MKLLIPAAVAVLLSLSASAALAASLRVAPVILDLKAPTAASIIRVWNDENRPLNVQVRVFRWSQRGGEDVYEATGEVVASPPIITLQPGGENLVRIVRTTQRPIQGEESYRIVVDELPDPSRRKGGTLSWSSAIRSRCSSARSMSPGHNRHGRSGQFGAAIR